MTEESIRTNPDQRLKSLDTLRGFDMFWIIGGGTLIGLLAKATNWNGMEVLAAQMHHAHWQASILKTLFSLYLCLFPE